MIMNPFWVRCLKISAAIVCGLLCSASLGLGVTTNTVPLTLSVVGNGALNPNYLNGQMLTVGQQYSLTAKARSSFTFTGWTITNGLTRLTSSRTTLTFVMTNGLALQAIFVDKQKPNLTIQTPPNSGALTNPVITITGTAKDNDAVTSVSYQLINNQNTNPGWQTASTGNGWNNWWVNNLTLAPNTNTLQAFAIDRSGNHSPTNKLKLTYSAAPPSFNGLTMTVTNNTDNSIYVENFGVGAFSEDSGVGTFTYKKTGAVSGNLALKYSAPPTAVNATNNVSVQLHFTDSGSGTFTDEGQPRSFNLATADTLAPVALTGSQITFISTNDTNQSILAFLTPPLVANNGNLFNVANPLVVSLASAYPGVTGDRVKVTFTHEIYFQGNWTTVSPKILAGTVIDIGTGTNSVTILFDNNPFKSKTDMYGPIVGDPVNIFSYYYTNFSNGYPVTNGTGTFNYTNYSPVGALLQLSQLGANDYFILTFTNASESGNYDVENYGGFGNTLQNVDAGTFAISLPPLVDTQPQPAALTNGETATFNVIAGGTPPLTYQWQFNGIDLTDGTNNSWSSSAVSGSLSNILTIAAASTNDLGGYQVIVANNFGTVTSSVATLAFALPPQIAVGSEPANQFPTNGGTADFFVTATGSLPLAYHWQINGTNLNDGVTAWNSTVSGSLTTNLTISAVRTNDTGFYQVIVTNAFGSVTSSPAAVLGISP